MHDRRGQRAHALRVKLEAVGWVMVRFLRRHSLDKSNSHTHLRKEEQESNSCTESDTAEMQEPGGNGGGGAPPLPNGRTAPRSRLARDGPPSGMPVLIDSFR